MLLKYMYIVTTHVPFYLLYVSGNCSSDTWTIFSCKGRALYIASDAHPMSLLPGLTNLFVDIQILEHSTTQTLKDDACQGLTAF